MEDYLFILFPGFSVKRAKGLKTKGKDGTNDAFVTIGLGKEKFRYRIIGFYIMEGIYQSIG